MMMKFKIITTLTIFTLLPILLLSSCSSQATPVVRDFDVQDLLITISDMPEGWEYYYAPAIVSGFDPTPYIGEAFFVPSHDKGGLTNIYVLVYKDNKVAARVFNFHHPGEVDPIPEEWLPFDHHADQYSFSCFNLFDPPSPSCSWEAQYREFIVKVSASMIPGYMSMNELGNIIKIVDARMVKYLGIQSP